jgi:hypothetical protein
MVFSFTHPDELAAARAGVRSGEIAMPLMADLTSQAISAAPSASSRLRPINLALRAAIQRVGLMQRLEAAESLEADGAATVEVVEAHVAEDGLENEALLDFADGAVDMAEQAERLAAEAFCSGEFDCGAPPDRGRLGRCGEAHGRREPGAGNEGVQESARDAGGA